MNIPWQPQDIISETKNLRDSLIQSPKMFAEKILKEDAVTASITMPIQMLSNDGNAVLNQTVTIPFYMGDNFSVGSLTNNWSELVNMDFVNSFTTLLNGAGIFTGSGQVTMQSEAMSLQSWKGSKYDGFSVNCLFVATNRRLNPPKIIKNLAAAALPTKLKGDNTAGVGVNQLREGAEYLVTKGWQKLNEVVSIPEQFKDSVEKSGKFAKLALDDLGMVAPLHYGLTVETDSGRSPLRPVPGTTLTLQVGDYFRATELLVSSIGSITFSKEIVAPPTDTKRTGQDLYDPSPNSSNYGFPLWGSCSLRLIPCSMLTKEKFQGYFLDSHGDGLDSLDTINSDLLGAAAKAYNSITKEGQQLKNNVMNKLNNVKSLFTLPS